MSAAPGKKTTDPGRYTAEDITALEGLEAVRRRPAMYIGDISSAGLTHLAAEVMDNAVDEASAGHADKLEITLHGDGSVEVSDNGRGIPTGPHPAGNTALEVVFTLLHAGGKFGGGAYAASGGLHGVGAAVVNAMSQRLDATVWRDGKRHRLGFRAGSPGQWSGDRFKPGSDLAVAKAAKGRSGTTVRFWPDLTLFADGSEIDAEALRQRAQQVSYLLPGVSVSWTDLRDGADHRAVFKEPSGLEGLRAALTGDREQVARPVILDHSAEFEETVASGPGGKASKVERTCRVSAALGWTAATDTRLETYVNTIPTTAGGTHREGMERGLVVAANRLLAAEPSRRLAKLAAKHPGGGQPRATVPDVLEGLTGALHVVLPEPQFAGQTKQALSTPAVTGIVSDAATEAVARWAEQSTRKDVAAVKSRIIDSMTVRIDAAARIREQRAIASAARAGLPAKLADSRVHGPEAELVLVEGDSAAGPAKRGRDSRFTAILPLRGKILNAAKSKPKQVADNAEAQAIFAAIGAGIGNDFDLSAARYGRVIILCDADVDGSHIRCLILTLIHHYLPALLAEGRVYTAMPPLYTARIDGKPVRAYSIEERDNLTSKAKGGEQIRWQRFKGLGEMNVDELRHCALDPETRTLKRLTDADADQTMRAFETMMGDDPARRRDRLLALADAAAADGFDV